MYQVDFKKPCHIYFMGIGGISMSGLAEILLKEGFKVSGSDMKESDITKMLVERGATVKIGQVAENITDDIDVIVYTAAIREDNEEFREAVKRGIEMLTRAQLLGQIMSFYKYSIAVAGTHGKTTTTAMMTSVLLAGEKDPTVSIGGILDSIGGNIRVGRSDYFVTEACEYTNSYHSFNPFISIILNVDNDHLDFFKNFDNIVESFRVFATKVTNGGVLIINGDMDCYDKIVSTAKCKVISFGTKDKNDYVAKDISLDPLGHPSYTVVKNGQELGRFTLNVTGVHNAVNSLSVIAAATELGMSVDELKEGLLNCKSAERRFDYKGTTEKGAVVVDDYAHHPTEIAATLKVANSIKKGDLWVAFQPHTYSRTKAHLHEFAEALSAADHIILADIYAAREKDDGTVSSKDLENLIRKKGTDAVYLGDFLSIEKYFRENSKENDLLITMGAGNIDSVGVSLVKK
ncbi:MULTISPECIES: UDP-N-acetylmuramate--L-alanine ligase [Eubacterium]|uniref:UDP-N-acetylmuramate--L-alanine ligase n=1 Tax=Eubacterium ruminantium TaxID=42322 RepID=A0A1T4PNH2_9FIRM|nr:MULTISPECIES: UDP-N-acetylmuramate--L-alanine ligase [Eubacterium]MCR5367112.1 UDP-N-acetylmuramate--L-alanine ligase [Eubacterium sp.]SCW61241.1 UDP-N-acetylmuramate--L-alanine ligase [Eubacterium ruminantium]SDN18080.1 UDP-N-acetylmuramate--L-alanine ligase [Eubacterium ruminantium]SJZ93114.1 UDP-N-acetylmuramate--L-alanine ligase [Eubacterium ruminantium]